MSCINIYHPDYIKLLSEIDDSIIPFELPTLIRLYQKMNNTDKIPSVSEIYEIDNRTKSQERLNQIQDIKIKEGVSELFESNPELANAVYEALGFKQNNLETAARIKKAEEDVKQIHKIGIDTEYEDVVKSQDKNRFHFLDTNNFKNTNQKSVNIEHIHVPEKYRNKGYGLSLYIVRGEELLKEGKSLISYDQHSPEAEIVWQRLLQLGLATQSGEYGTYQYVGLKGQITPQQKQQATFMFSEFLDVYLEDFEQVEKILKEEKIIKKDCTGGGKLKAEKGLQTNFTKGSEWEIVKDLKGYPSHAQGGVDIKLGKDGFSFTGKNGEIKAAHGLVLSKIIAGDGLVAPESEDDYYINKNNKVKKFFKNEEDRKKYRTNLTNMYENELKSSPSSLPYISKYRTNIFDAEKNTQLNNNSMECIDCVSGIIRKTGYDFNAPSTKDGHYLGNMTFYDNVNAGKEDMYRVNGNFQVGDIVQTLSYKMGEKSSWYAPYDAKIIAKIETDENGRKVYKMRGGSGGGKVSGTDMYEEDLRNPKLKLVTRPGYFLDKDKLQKERQGSNEIKNILKKREEDLQLKLNENVNYTFRIKKDSPDYNENTKPIMDYFIEYSNNPENIKELVRKTGSSKEEIYDSLKNAFGILGQENKWQDRYVGGAYGIENTIDKLQQFFNTGDSYSQGIAQIKMNTIKNKPKRKDGTFEKSLAEIYGIEKNSDLSDIKKVLPLLVALDLKNKETFKNWGKNGTLSEKLYGIKSNLKYEDIKDYGRLAPYLINNYSNIANRTIKTPLGKTIKNDGSDPYTPIVKYKIDKGSYPAKIWEAWLKNLDVEKLNND